MINNSNRYEFMLRQRLQQLGQPYETGSGPYYRVFTKTFNIYGNHRLGVFNAYFSASTRESLYDDDISKFASDMVGIPFKVIKKYDRQCKKKQNESSAFFVTFICLLSF